MCQRCLELFAASQATEVVRKVVRKVISKVVRHLIRKVITTCTSFRTTLLTRQLMTFDHGSSWFCRGELATPPPANEGEIAGQVGPIGGERGGQFCWGGRQGTGSEKGQVGVVQKMV